MGQYYWVMFGNNLSDRKFIDYFRFEQSAIRLRLIDGDDVARESVLRQTESNEVFVTSDAGGSSDLVVVAVERTTNSEIPAKPNGAHV